ncbi:uncharacterized protein EI90DRAFT_3053950 [Cantharellus anzutake]|uniref:uncharacterized protein n=1 Tax=Cantharellus anzutake TaxID=1750568 RepID=UPI00190604C5|nr:uncharacterized protein EI90DRAFT_3053950 [Cantharellus anzutake]KAF8332664.1 hypothetical protein EI90DRAFT_3053950 [Cantharellus anzutake]
MLSPDPDYDGLSQRAQEELSSLSVEHQSAGLANILEMHGCILTTQCTLCKHTQYSTSPDLCPSLAQSLLAEDPNWRIPIDELPHCGGSNWKLGSSALQRKTTQQSDTATQGLTSSQICLDGTVKSRRENVAVFNIEQ